MVKFCRYYGKKVIILLDEYDTLMQEAYVHGYWEELVAFTRSMFSAAFKTNPWLERGIMTGITRVSKESIFSDLNHLEVVTTTAGKYETVFGFTETEVFVALDEFEMGEEKEKVRWWYDGFIFGASGDIYNPWAILNLLDKKDDGLLGEYQLQRAGGGADQRERQGREGVLRAADEGGTFLDLHRRTDHLRPA